MPWLIRGSTCAPNASHLATGFLKLDAYKRSVGRNKHPGSVVSTQDHQYPEQQGFSTADIVWALGIWSVILSLSPVVVFYVLMVN